MIDTDKYENMRLLFLDFIDTASDEIDEEAWKDKLTTLDELLSEVKRLRDLVEFAIAAIDSNHCYMGEEAQVDLRDYLKEMIE